MITEEKIYIIGKNIEDFKKQLPKDIEFIDVSYNGGNLDIKFKNHYTNESRYLWIKSMDYKTTNTENINKTRLCDFNQKFIKPDLYDDIIIKKIKNAISNYKPKIQREYEGAVDLNVNLYNDISFYKKEKSIIISQKDIIAEFEDDNLVYINDNEYIDDMISSYENFIKYNNQFDLIDTKQRLLVKTNIVDKAIKNSKKYKELSSNRKEKKCTILIIINIVLSLVISIYAIVKVFYNIIKYGFYIRFEENLILFFLPFIVYVFYKINSVFLERKLFELEKEQEEWTYEFEETDPYIPNYIDLNSNERILNNFNLNKEDIIKTIKNEKDIKVKDNIKENQRIKSNIKEIENKLVDLRKNLDIANKLDLIEDNDLINKYYLPEMNLTISKYDTFNDEYKQKVIDNINMINKILEKEIEDYYKYGEIEVDVLNNELKSKLV